MSVAFLYEATSCTQASVFPGQISVALILSTNNAPVSRGSFDEHTRTHRHACACGATEKVQIWKHANVKENSIVIIMKNEI